MKSHGFLIFFILVLTAVTVISSCTVLKSNRTKSIVSIDDTPISTEEFLYVYNKNNINEQPVTHEELQDYLDLFINFKLKVKEAENLGLHMDSAFIKELDGYQKQLAAPYLTETRILDSLARATYERLKEEVNASHILIQVAADANPADTLAAFNKIKDLRTRSLSGEDFNDLARKSSEDPSARQNNGNLGYFSAMQMVYPFEVTAYSLNIDSISNPIRTNFGYHIIKLHDRRPSQGKIQVSHILVRALDSLNPSDSTLAANRAQEIYQLAVNQQDWDRLCRQFSEDVGTKNKGGTLPWFKTGDISNIPSFEKAAFSLKDLGDICEPVKSAYGWHIIRLDGKQELEPFEEMESSIRSNLSANSRKELNQQALVNRLKQENNYLEFENVIDEAISHGNDSLTSGNWHSNDQWGNYHNVMFRIGESDYKIEEFYKFVESHQPFQNESKKPSEIMRYAFTEFSNEKLIEYEEAHLADKYYDYKMLLNEYRDGILLFQLMETKVWNQAVQDTLGLQEFFNDHQHQYQWEKRVNAQIFNVIDEKALQQVKEFLDLGYFSFEKYDFFGSGATLNKAQLKILDNVSQKLLAEPNRTLVLEYDNQLEDNQQIHQNIVSYITGRDVNNQRIVVNPLKRGTEKFLMYLTGHSIKDLEENMNRVNPLTLQVESGQYQRGDNPLLDQLEWKVHTTSVNADDRIMLIKIEETLDGGNQQLDEIKGQVISDYQTKLEKDWVIELREKYPVEVNEKQLDAVYQQYSN